MVLGDVVSSLALIATTAQLSFQPAAGIEARIDNFGSNALAAGNSPNKTPDIWILITDGVNDIDIVGSNGQGTGMYIKAPIWINNTIYLGVINANGASAYIGFCGVQTK